MQPVSALPDDAPALDLTACEREAIHIPASIQPHGFYLGLREDGTVIQVSANLGALAGTDADAALGKTLADLLGADNGRKLREAMAGQNLQARTVYLGAVALANGGFFDALAHANGDMTVIEFEQVARRAHADFRLLYPLIGSFLAKLTDIDDIERMSDVAAREIKELTGFGRVLVYRFDEEGHGHVLAEAIEPGYHSYLHQRFPASDVPRQARALYLANRIRLIRDASYVPSPLLPAHHPLTGEPTDLTYSALRSVSPVHLRYMKNMHTMASMSVSIVVKGKLWGLISCHNTEPKSAPFESRAACEQLAQLLALRIESKEEADQYRERLELRRVLVVMLGALTQGTDLAHAMTSVAHELLRFGRATGAALVSASGVTRFGDAPPDSAIAELAQWLAASGDDDVFYSNALSRVYPGGQAMRDKASGILALPISRMHRHYLLWFRAEVVQTIDWAGNPYEKTAQAPALSPRQSFEIWRETVVGTSLPWRDSEIEIAGEFRRAVLGIVLERAEQMAELAEELGRSNKELEAFSYSVSHDLRAPMRHIVGFTDLLLETESAKVSERGVRFLHNIKDAARFAGKLVDDLLSFSQMGRAALRLGQVDMQALAEASIERMMQDAEKRQVNWQVQSLPTIAGDAAFLQLALYNLLSNALKYTRPRAEAVITVSAEHTPAEWIFHVRDNGVGFSMEYGHKLFGVFQRLHRMEEFEGTGIGLANVRRIIERHGGRVWAQGAPDAGATFSFAIPKQIHSVDHDKHAKTHTPR